MMISGFLSLLLIVFTELAVESCAQQSISGDTANIITAIAAVSKSHQGRINLFILKSFHKNAFPNTFTPI
jgi:hypothetical protein